MPEAREIKFSESKIEKKQEEALDVKRRAEEIVEKGEAKTKQEAVEKMEEKELKEKTV